MNVKCFPSTLSGRVAAIPSKSDAHRKLICAALSENGAVLPISAPFCDDIAATISCLRALGAEITMTENGVNVRPIRRVAQASLDCGESGSTLRFLLPVAMAVCDDVSVAGHGRLPDRPIGTLVDAMSTHGVHFSHAKLPLRATGCLSGGIYEIPGNVSSQFLSGLLMALPLCREDSEIHLTTGLQSSAYVEMTLDTLYAFCIKIDVDTSNSNYVYRIPGRQKLYAPMQLSVDGDWSNAAFWLTAGAIQSDQKSSIRVDGLDLNSTQGDRAILSVLREGGACISECNDGLSACGVQYLPICVSMEGIPDLLPILAVKAALADGKSEFVDAARLRLKESDRLRSVAEMLSALGGQVEEHPDGLTIFGGDLHGGIVNAQNDHRLVMAAAIAALKCSEPVTILGAEAVNKSYPSFFVDYIALGGRVEKC